MDVSHRRLATFAVGTLSYFAAAQFGLSYATTTSAVTLLWAPAGIGLFLLLIDGPPMLASIATAQLAISVFNGSSWDFTLAAMFAGCAEALTAWLLLSKLGFRYFDEGAGDVLRWIVVVGIGTWVGATIGVTGLSLSNQVDAETALSAFRSWWIGDFMGVLVIAPFLIACWQVVTQKDRRLPRSKLIEFGILLAILVWVCNFVFAMPVSQSIAHVTLSFLVLPFVGIASYRFAVLGATTTNLLVAVFAVWGELDRDRGVSELPLDTALSVMWAFVFVSIAGSLTLASAVAARRRIEDNLRDSLTWLELIQNETGVGVWSWNFESNTMRIAPSSLSVVGAEDYPVSEVIEYTHRWVHPDDRERVIRELVQARDTRKRVNIDFRMPDGVSIAPGVDQGWCTLTAACVPVDPEWPDGPSQMVTVLVDVSAKRKLEALARRNERLAAIGTFAAGLAHEVNNPVGGILIAACRAREQIDDPKIVAQSLDDIIEDANRTGRIVKSVLQYANPDLSERDWCDVNACLRNAANASRKTVAGRGLALELDLSQEALELRCNPSEIERLIVNLIQNSALACSPRGKIRIESSRCDGHASILVSDDGCGIDESELEHVFDPFYSTRSHEGGSGLGLSMCLGIVQSHDGKIEIHSRPGEGCRVEITFPLEEEL